MTKSLYELTRDFHLAAASAYDAAQAASLNKIENVGLLAQVKSERLVARRAAKAANAAAALIAYWEGYPNSQREWLKAERDFQAKSEYASRRQGELLASAEHMTRRTA